MTPELLDCRAAQESLGVLVLGAIEPSERDQVEAHIRTCGSCAAHLAELAPLAGRLKRVDITLVDGSPAPASILDGALERVLAQHADDEVVEARGRSRPRAAVILGVVAAAAVVLAGLVGATSAHVFPFSAPASLVASADNPTTGVVATVTLHASEAGTQVLLALSGVAPGAHCQLVAVGRDGQREVAAAWVATYDGEAHVAGTTGLSMEQIASFDVTTPQGATVATVPLPA